MVGTCKTCKNATAPGLPCSRIFVGTVVLRSLNTPVSKPNFKLWYRLTHVPAGEPKKACQALHCFSIRLLSTVNSIFSLNKLRDGITEQFFYNSDSLRNYNKVHSDNLNITLLWMASKSLNIQKVDLEVNLKSYKPPVHGNPQDMLSHYVCTIFLCTLTSFAFWLLRCSFSFFFFSAFFFFF